VKEYLTAYYNGYQYKIGEGDKQDLKPNQSIDCGDGWHFTNLEGAIKWLKENKKGKIISAEINPEDMLHISWKVRVRAFKNVQVVNVDYLLT
jgi:ribosomal protein L24E